MELRHLRYFVAVGEEEHYGRAAQRLRLAQPALSRQIQDLEHEIGFQLFDRLPRGVKINAAGKLFLEDARRILQQVSEATVRARQVARGQAGTLRVGFTENASWRGVVPDSFRLFRKKSPEVELHLNPMASLEQLEAVRSGRLDAGFIYNVTTSDDEIEHIRVGLHRIVLALPKGHPLCKAKRIHLSDLVDVPFILFPRKESPVFYDRLMSECYRGGLKSPHVVQEARQEATILSLVAQGMGAAFTNETAHWRCPESVVVLPVTDLRLTLSLALVWRKNNTSALLARFVAEVRRLPEANNG